MKSTSVLLIFRSFLVPFAPAMPTTEVPTTRIITTQPTPSPTCRSRNASVQCPVLNKSIARQFACCCHKRQLTFAWKVLNLAMHWWLSVSRVWIGLSKAEKTFLNVSIFLWSNLIWASTVVVHEQVLTRSWLEHTNCSFFLFFFSSVDLEINLQSPTPGAIQYIIVLERYNPTTRSFESYSQDTTNFNQFPFTIRNLPAGFYRAQVDALVPTGVRTVSSTALQLGTPGMAKKVFRFAVSLCAKLITMGI